MDLESRSLLLMLAVTLCIVAWQIAEMAGAFRP